MCEQKNVPQDRMHESRQVLHHKNLSLQIDAFTQDYSRPYVSTI